LVLTACLAMPPRNGITVVSKLFQTLETKSTHAAGRLGGWTLLKAGRGSTISGPGAAGTWAGAAKAAGTWAGGPGTRPAGSGAMTVGSVTRRAGPGARPVARVAAAAA
jgi:hypothetical protein